MSALGKGVVKLVSKISGKLGRETAEQAAKAVATSSDNVFSGLRHLWKGADEAVEQSIKSVERSGKELIESTLHKDFAGDFARKVRETTNKIHQSLSGAEAQANSVIQSGAPIKRVGDLLKDNPDEFIQRAVGDDLGVIIVPESIKGGGPETIKNYVRNMIRDPLSRMQQAEVQLHYVNRAKDVMREPNGLQNLKSLLDVERKEAGGFFGSGLERNVPELRNLIDDVNEVYSLNRSSVSDRKFIQEAISLASDPSNAETFKLFMANPSNASRWAKMKMSSGFVGDMIKRMDPRISLKRKLIGITPKETAKHLGLGLATLGAGYGAVKVYNWFGNNDPKRVESVGASIQSSLPGIDSKGVGQSMIQDVQSSISKITHLANNVNSGLGEDNAPEAIRSYLSGVSTEIGKITNNLEKWDLVVNSATNKPAALALGNNLVEFVRDTSGQIGKLSSQIGVSIEETGKAGITDTNISKVQDFLGLHPSGKLDRDTAERLRDLENEFNRRAGTNRFSGVFVVPEIGHVIDYNNLVQAYQRIQKY